MYSIIRGKEDYSSSFIKEFDEQQFHDIVKYVNELDVEEFDAYESLYLSRYNTFPSSSKRDKLNKELEYLKNSSVLEINQSRNDYEWVYIKRKETGNTAYRYYFGINPLYIYDVVEELTKKFISYGIPVSFKYQKDVKKSLSDRIILYADLKNKQAIEKVINEVYCENKELFDKPDRALPWIYESNTPGVYLAPESYDHEKSYGENFSKALVESKGIFHYFYQEDRVKNQEQLEFLKKVVISSMLKNGVLLESSGKRLRTYEPNIKTFYNKNSNTIKNVIDEKDGNYYETTYDSSIEAKKAFLKNFYSVKSVEVEPGVEKRVLSRQERINEIYRMLYPSLVNGTQKK